MSDWLGKTIWWDGYPDMDVFDLFWTFRIYGHAFTGLSMTSFELF